MSKAVLGLDGLDPRDIGKYDFPGEWDTIDIETVAHTCPSWNGIFTGEEREGVYDFFKVPDSSGMLAQESDERFSYADLRIERYPWERYDIEVVSAPVILPAYSTVWGRTPSEYGWPTTKEEVTESINVLTEETLGCENVLTVYPAPDKCNHLVDNRDKDYNRETRENHMKQLKEAVNKLTDHFDEYILVSDHGRPGNKEWPLPDLWVPSHNSTGVIRSNTIETGDIETNLDVYDAITRLFNDA